MKKEKAEFVVEERKHLYFVTLSSGECIHVLANTASKALKKAVSCIFTDGHYFEGGASVDLVIDDIFIV